MRPGIWYLILAFGYLAISIWSLYFVCSMFETVRDTICKSALFVDSINFGAENTYEWVGTARLGKQINIFVDEATITQQNYNTFINTYSSPIQTLIDQKYEIYTETEAMFPFYSAQTVEDFSDDSTPQTLAEF